MKIKQITESGYITDPKDFDPENIEVQIKGYGVLTLSQIKNKIKGMLETLAKKVDQLEPESLKHAMDNSVLPYMIQAYVDATAELNTPQMKRKATIARKKAQYSAEAYSAVAKHIAEGVPFCDSIFRHGSEAYFETINLARDLYRAGLIETDWESAEMLESDMGQQVNLKELGTVYLDTPFIEEEVKVNDFAREIGIPAIARDMSAAVSKFKNQGMEEIDEGARETIMAFALVGGLLLGGAVGVNDYKLTQEWMQTYEEIKETDPARADKIKKLVTQYKSYPFKVSGMKELTKQKIEKIIADAAPEKVEEAEYQGKKVELNKPKRGGSKKFYVYVKNPKTGKVKKVSFGAASGGGSLAVKLKDPKARKAFADRHNCDQKNDKTKPGYWSCRLPRYAKSLGLSGGGTWW